MTNLILKIIPPSKSIADDNWNKMVESEKDRCKKMEIDFIPFTSQQRKFGLWLFNHSDDISRIGDMERVFEVVSRFIKRRQP